MLNETFLSRLGDEFPEFYARVDEQARSEAARLRIAAKGDVGKALARARIEGAARLWWPYVKGSVPLAKRERDAMEGFSRLVLTVGHVVGHEPGGMEQARMHVVGVLRQSLDYERLKDLVESRGKKADGKDEAKAAVAGAGIMASLTTMMAPVTMFRSARRYVRFVPPPARVVVAAVVVAALASVPFVAGFSAGHKAEQAARAGTQPIEAARASDDIQRAA